VHWFNIPEKGGTHHFFPHFSGLFRNSQVMISRNSKSFESFVEQQRQEGLEEIRAAIFVGLASPENTKYHHDHTWWDHMKICENLLIHMNIYIKLAYFISRWLKTRVSMKNLVIFLAKSPQNGKIFFLCRIWFSTILSDKILGFSQHCQREAPNSPKL